MKISLAEDRREALVGHLQSLFRDDFDEDLTDFRADAIIDLMLRTLGPVAYNQAVQDVREHLQSRLDAIDGEVYVDPEL